MLLSLHITSISATMCTLLMDLLDNDTDSWGKSVLSEEGISTWLQNFSAQAKFWWTFIWYMSTFRSFAQSTPIHILLPWISFLRTFQLCSLHSLTIQSVHWLQYLNQWATAHLAISFFKKTVQPFVLLKVLPTVKSSPYQHLSWLSSEEVAMPQLFTSEHLEPWLNLFPVFSSTVKQS